MAAVNQKVRVRSDRDWRRLWEGARQRTPRVQKRETADFAGAQRLREDLDAFDLAVVVPRGVSDARACRERAGHDPHGWVTVRRRDQQLAPLQDAVHIEVRHPRALLPHVGEVVSRIRGRAGR